MNLNCGLPIELIHGKLAFKGIPAIEPKPRTAGEMKAVLFDKSAANNEAIYLMYRDIKMQKHASLFRKHSLRYDITIILPKMLGTEFPKTLGHYHALSKKVSFPEAYEVLSGKAHFLLQKGIESIKDVVIVEASAGDIVIVTPDYGHVTINPSSKALAISNLVCPDFTSDYQPIIARGGAAYFETVNGFIKNKKYNAPELRFVKASGIKNKFFGSNQMTPSKDDRRSSSNLASSNRKPMYEIFVGEPEKFEFLTKPEEHLKEMEGVLRGQ